MKRLLALCFVICIFMPSMSIAATDVSGLSPPEAFIQNVTDQIVKLIRSSKSMAQKKEHFRQMLHKNFDMRTIGKFVLARYWRIASESEKKEFLRLFEQNMVDSYTSQFDEYKDETVRVTSSKTGRDGDIWVSAEVEGSEREPFQLRWKVYKINGQFKIYDIYVNEASMSITHRSEYASIIQRQGGTIEGLLAELRSSKQRRANT